MTQSSEETIGLIGLGIMGRPMATHLMDAGYRLRVYNRTASKADALVEKGAIRCASPAEAARGAAIVITIVSDTPDVVQVITGENGVLSGAARGTIVIDMSTISPDTTRKIAAQAEAAGLEYVDAPVSGGEKGAIGATLTVFCGGKPEVVDRCLPILKTLGSSVTRMGGSGSGQAAKLANQIIGAVTHLAICEGLLYASKAGLDLTPFITACMGGSAQSALLGRNGPKIAARDFAPGFMVKLQQKDLRLVMEAAHEMGVPVLGTSLAYQLYTMVEVEEGGDSLGNHALVKALEKLAGYEIGQGKE